MSSSSRTAAGLLAALAIAGVLASCGSTQAPAKAVTAANGVATVTSNVRFADYAGSRE